MLKDFVISLSTFLFIIFNCQVILNFDRWFTSWPGVRIRLVGIWEYNIGNGEKLKKWNVKVKTRACLYVLWKSHCVSVSAFLIILLFLLLLDHPIFWKFRVTNLFHIKKLIAEIKCFHAVEQMTIKIHNYPLIHFSVNYRKLHINCFENYQRKNSILIFYFISLKSHAFI